MKTQIVISAAAEQAYATLDAWWRANRKAAAEQVANELERIKALLAEQPAIGVPYKPKRLDDVRCLPVRKTPYKLYYRYEANRGVITIMAIWSAMRRRGPTLAK